MFSNYLKVAIRSLRKRKSFTFINIAGLAVGLASCVLILVYVFDELSYDRFHEKADRIFRTEYHVSMPHQETTLQVTPSVIGPLVKREIPEVENTARVYNYTSYGPVLVRVADRAFQEQHFLFADSTVFDIFTLPLLQGDPRTALTRPTTVIISESAARKYFPNENPVGRTINVGDARDYEITGIFRDLPRNSHLQIDFLASYTSLTMNWAKNESWSSANLYTYLLLRTPGQRSIVTEKAQQLVERERGEQLKSGGVTITYILRPLRDIHLRWDGNPTTVYVFLTIATLILLIACFNYMNLATARAALRSQEVGMRKVLGANRRQLAVQFFGESALLTILSLLVAAVLIVVSLPSFNMLSGKQYVLADLLNPTILLAIVIAGVLAALVSGSYPALLLSGFQPLGMLKPGKSSISGGSKLRKFLVVCQFAVSIILIVATAVVFDQLDFIRSKNLGFQKEQVLALSIDDRAAWQNHEVLKKELLQHSNILHAAAASDLPGSIRGGYTITAEGIEQNRRPRTIGFLADEDIAETLDLRLIAGKGFTKPWREELGTEYLVNEAALGFLGWQPQEAIGRRIGTRGELNGRIVGVVKDFHFASLHNEITPLVTWIEPRAFDYLMIKVSLSEVTETIGYIQQVWQQVVPHYPFELIFLDQEFEKLYNADVQVSRIFSVFAVLALFVASLGLLGLASFMAEQRRQEIGVRKVLGASVQQVIALLSRDFSKLVLLAFLVAVPLGWYASTSWLQNFAYRLELSWPVFVLAGLATFVVAMVTVSFQAYRAAMLNPVDALRDE